MNAVPQVYLDHLAAVTGPEPALLRKSWEEDGVLEFPYGVGHVPVTRFEGVDAIVELFTAGSKRFGDFAFSGMQAWPVEGGRAHVLEMHGSSTIMATGAPYEQDYIVRFGLAESGRIAWMREFWDPTRL